MGIPLYGQNKGGDTLDRQRGLVYHDVAATTHNNTVTAADITSFDIPAGVLQVGSLIKVRSCIKVIDNNSTDTLTAICTLGSVSGVTSGAIDVDDNDIIYFDMQFVVTKLGTAGTAVSMGYVGTDATGSTLLHADQVDMTSVPFNDANGPIAVKVAVNVDWSVAHAHNQATHQWTTIELS